MRRLHSQFVASLIAVLPCHTASQRQQAPSANVNEDLTPSSSSTLQSQSVCLALPCHKMTRPSTLSQRQRVPDKVNSHCWKVTFRKNLGPVGRELDGRLARSCNKPTSKSTLSQRQQAPCKVNSYAWKVIPRYLKAIMSF